MQSEQKITMDKLPEQNTTTEQLFRSICNLCSVGCTLNLAHNSGSVTKTTGASGLINNKSEYCLYPTIGYSFLKDSNRITEPLLKKGENFEPITWDEALNLLHKEIAEGVPAEKAFFAGARLTNEEQFLIMKLCRACAKSNNIGSFHYLGRGTGYTKLSRANIPFAELVESKKIFLIGANVIKDNPVAGEFILRNRKDYNIPISVISDSAEGLAEIANEKIIVQSYFHFIQAVNHLIVANGTQNSEYIANLIDNFDDYKTSLLSKDYSELVKLAGVTKEVVEKFASEYQNEPNAVIVFSEKILSGHTCGEIFNLALLTGKHGKTGAGLLLLKENNNSHGLHDMGAMWNLGPGAVPWDDPFQRSTVQFVWRSDELPTDKFNGLHKLRESGYEKLFIFGEDPIGCAIDQQEMTSLLSKSKFIMVQDYFMTPTAELANLILPASLPYETGGTFTNSQRVIQKVDKRVKSPLSMDSWRQLEELLARCGYARYETVDDVTFEVASLLPKFCTSSKLLFRIYAEDNLNPMFNYGCDSMFRIAKTN